MYLLRRFRTERFYDLSKGANANNRAAIPRHSGHGTDAAWDQNGSPRRPNMQRTKSIMTILSAALILSACQASSSSSPPTATTTTSTTPTTHTALALPPMPDTTTNNATVAGVDSNGDGIRDDVEIWISQTWQPGTPKYYAARQLARTTQQEISQVNNINRIWSTCY